MTKYLNRQDCLDLMLDNAEDIYLDYLNNFITLEGFCNHYGLTVDEANTLIDKGRAA